MPENLLIPDSHAAAPADAATGDVGAPVSAAAASASEGYGFAALSAAETRVVGCLVEKQITTPEYYPLTLNALVAACNQKNNRNPVVEYDEKTVVRTIDALREKKLLWMVTLAGGRVPKYEHRLGEKLLITKPGEMAIICELLLRGPQTPGELRSRVDRMHSFASLEEVQGAIEALASRPVPLVLRLPRLPGHKESRYSHLLSGAPEAAGQALLEPPPEPARVAAQADEARFAALETEIKSLRQELADLRAAFEQFKAQF